jgi:TRAP-type C4-dicarboxylate transport system permease small subunit
MKLVRYACRLHDAITDLGYIIGVIGLSAMVLIFCAEVVSRYFLRYALGWANDTFANVLCVTIFVMVPHATRNARHIAVDLVPELIPAARRPLYWFTGLAGFIICAFVAWMSLQENARQIALSILTAQNYPIPVVWMSSFITYAFASSSLYFLRSLFPRPELSPVSRVAPMPTTVSHSVG